MAAAKDTMAALFAHAGMLTCSADTSAHVVHEYLPSHPIPSQYHAHLFVCCTQWRRRRRPEMMRLGLHVGVAIVLGAWI